MERSIPLHSPPMKVSAIIVTFSQHDLLRTCLRSVEKAMEGVDGEIIVVDNASTDATPQVMAEEFPRVRYIRNPVNLYYTRAVNQGMRAATGEYVYLLNDDTELEPGNIRELSNIVERAAVLCKGQTITPDDLPPQVLSAPPAVAPTLRLAEHEDLAWTPCTLDEALREPERRILLAALNANQWNRQKTADVLGINRTTLYKKMKHLGIEGAE